MTADFRSHTVLGRLPGLAKASKLSFPSPAWYKSKTERLAGSPTPEEAANTKF
jgi:hypothetical protein